MRTLILALAVILLAAPAWATVEIVLEETDRVITISYTSDEGQRIRAFALDIVATDGNIVDINDFAVGDNNGGYGIFPGSFANNITVNTTTGDVDSWAGNPDPYTPVAPAGDPDALDGLDSNGVTVEMGSLYSDNPPSISGPNVLCTITVDDDVTEVCVTGNAIRGNIVMEDAAEIIPAEACISVPSDVGPDCFPSDTAHQYQYADWVAMGKPACWCNSAAITDPTVETDTSLMEYGAGDYQCHGDADTNWEHPVFKHRVFIADLTLVGNDWKKVNPPDIFGLGLIANPCADINHGWEHPVFKYRVFIADLTILGNNWKKVAAPDVFGFGVVAPDCPLTDAALGRVAP